MTARKKTGASGSPRLRRNAKNALSRYREETPKTSADEKLVSELEAQNEALRDKQEEIEEAGRRYLDLYDFAPTGYFVFDQRGIIVDLNLTGARLLGLPRNQIIGTPFIFFLDREFVQNFQRHLRKVFSGNQKETCELKIRQRFQKSVTHVSIESVVLNTDKGTTCRSAVIDITARIAGEKELLRTREELLRRNAQLRRLSDNLFEKQEEERSRVAGDVHDSFASLLCVIKDQLRFFEGKGDDDRLKRVLNQLDIAIRDAIRIQKALRPPVLDDLGLFPALDMLCREFQDSHAHIHVEKKFLLPENEVPDSIEIPIYRIAQEAFENIATHSGADAMTISLARKDSFIDFVVEDNGRGFDVEETLASGVEGGLSTMRQRAVLSGGVFNIESEAGKGTTLRVSWPFS